MKLTNYYSRLRAVVGLMAASLLLGTVTVQAQSRTRDTESNSARIGRSTSRTTEMSRLRGSNRFFQDGLFYSRKGGRLAVATAPVGAVVHRLPSGARVIRMNGKAYFRHRGIFYVEVRGGFRVVEPPRAFQSERIRTRFDSAGLSQFIVLGRGVYVWLPGSRADRFAADRGHREGIRENLRSNRPGRGFVGRPAQRNRDQDRNPIRNRRSIDNPEAGSLRLDD